MIFGMDTYTFVHVLLSLIGIVTGFIVLFGLLTASRMNMWTAIFIVTTLATTLTGFGFPYTGFTPAIGVGIVSTIVLIITIAARYAFRLSGSWRWIYAGGAVLSLLPQLLRADRAVVPEDPGAERLCADRIGAAIRHHPRHRAAGIRGGGGAVGPARSSRRSPELHTAQVISHSTRAGAPVRSPRNERNP